MKRSRSGIFLIVSICVAVVLGVGVGILAHGAIAQSSFTLPRQQAAQPAAQETSAATQAPAAARTYTISMVGDCTLASSQYNNDFDSYIEKNGLEWPFSGTLSILGADEFTLANLECSFSDTALSSSSLFQFRGPASYAGILTAGSVECVTLGNNHTYDFGEQGLTDTEAALDAVGVSYAEPGDAEVFTSANGLRIGVYCPGWTGLSEANIQSGVAALQRAGAELIIVSVHWGTEGSYQLTSAQKSYAHAAIDAGADIVFGTHPHVLQQAESYGGGYIFYSLGNWSFGGNTAPRDRDTAIAQVSVTKGADGSVTLEGFELIPCCLSSTAGVNDYRPVPYASGSEEYLRTMSKLDGSFTGADLSVDYSFITG